MGIDPGTLKSPALVICFALFTGIALWLALSRSQAFGQAARLPLEDENAADDVMTKQSGRCRHD